MSILRSRRFAVIAGLTSLLALAYVGSHSRTEKPNLEFLRSTLSWDSNSASHSQPIYVPITYPDVSESQFIVGTPGYHLFENLYLFNGTWFFVSSLPDDSVQRPPQNGHILCGVPTDEGKRTDAGTDRFARIAPEEASEMLGSKVAIRLAGSSIWYNDEAHPKAATYMGHYFHFVGEAFLGAWRLLTSDEARLASSSATSHTLTPRRMMFRTPPSDWRDRAGLSTWFLNNILPETAVEDQFVWADRKSSGSVFLFERLVIVDRFAAHRYGQRNGMWNKMTAELSRIQAPSNWISPLRERMLSLGHLFGCELEHRRSNVPVVTYINRQKTGRRLTDEDAENLLVVMSELDRQGVIEFHNAEMENIPRIAQFCLATKTDIMMGVHGNGLSHQLWMKPGGAVIEIMDIGGFALDYAVPAKLMGHRYHAIHNDTVFRQDQWVTDKGKPTYQSAGFHGHNIRVDGAFMKSLIQELADQAR